MVVGKPVATVVVWPLLMMNRLNQWTVERYPSCSLTVGKVDHLVVLVVLMLLILVRRVLSELARGLGLVVLVFVMVKVSPVVIRRVPVVSPVLGNLVGNLVVNPIVGAVGKDQKVVFLVMAILANRDLRIVRDL